MPDYPPITEKEILLSDVTEDNVSITKHGFVPKAPNDVTKFLSGLGTWVVNVVSNLNQIATRNHSDLQNVTADQHHAQSHTLASHSTKAHSELTGIGSSDHHVRYADSEAVAAAKTVKLDDFTAPDDNTDLNVSTSRHGLVPKAPNDATKFLNGQGNYTVPPSGSVTENIYTANDTWTKPAGCNFVLVEVIGGGGGGGGSTNSVGGGGGGGGCRVRQLFNANTLSATESIVVGAQVSGGAAGSDGNNGNLSSFGSQLIARGGLAGKKWVSGNYALGGAGGSGRYTTISSAGGVGEQGGAPACPAEFGGAGGGSGTPDGLNSSVGANSTYGAGGGGGGSTSAYAKSGGYSGGLAGGSPGNNGSAGTAGCGSGGGGGIGAGTGGAGGIPAGGGGGGGTTGAGGAGARGEVRVWAW